MAIEEGKSLAYLDFDEPTPDMVKLDWLMDFCFAVTDRLEELGMTRKELAKKLGKSPSNVTRVLGGRANITLDTMASYVAALRMDVEFKVKDNHEPPAARDYSVEVRQRTLVAPSWSAARYKAHETKVEVA